MRSYLAFLAVVFLVSAAQGKEYLPNWDALSVTWFTYSALPMTAEAAVSKGWTKESSRCSGSFFGHRYILKDDPAVMLLFDTNGNIAGFQTGVRNTTVTPKKLPWNKEDDLYVVTVYFTDPKFICRPKESSRPNPGYIGDKLFFQTGKTPKDVMEVPHAEEDIKKQEQWVLGRCFYSMGTHYWYKISKSMDCTHFFPFFVMYNGNKLNAFGFVMDSNQKSDRFEHPTPYDSKWTFREETRPRCLDDPLPERSSIHVYLESSPYFNFC